VTTGAGTRAPNRKARERANADLTRAEVVSRIGEQTTALWS
jgi:hypothetical protein